MPGADYIKLGEWEFPSATAPRVTVLVEFTAKAKVDKKESDGKDDAKTTYKGKAPADNKVTLTWPEWEAAAVTADNPEGKTAEDVYVRKALKELNPRGPKAGQPWEVTHVDAELFDVASIMFEEMALKREAGTNKITVELKGASWVKPKATAKGAGKATTPDRANEWKQGTPAARAPQALDAQQSFGGKTPPAVKP